ERVHLFVAHTARAYRNAVPALGVLGFHPAGTVPLVSSRIHRSRRQGGTRTRSGSTDGCSDQQHERKQRNLPTHVCETSLSFFLSAASLGDQSATPYGVPRRRAVKCPVPPPVKRIRPRC